MMGLSGSGFEAFSPSPDQLVIVAHHAKWALVLAGFSLLGALGLYLRSRVPGTGQGGIRILALILLVLGVTFGWDALEHGRMVFSKSAGTLTVERTSSFGQTSRYENPLTEVQYAEVRTSRSNQKLCVVIRGGGCVGLKGFVTDQGQYAAADAVNEFLGLHPPGK